MHSGFPPTTWQQREPIYEDVVQLIFPGFLSHKVTIQSTTLNLRSLNPGDTVLLRARINEWGEWKSWAVATATWMLDGHNLLSEPHAVPRLRQAYLSLPPRTRDLLYSLLHGLLLRRDRAIELAEAYCLEDSSRFMWKTIGGDRHYVSHLGVPGVERLGLNHVQQMWLAFNEFEDQREEYENAWACSKLTASSMAPKGIQKIDRQEMTRKREEKARQQLLLDGAFYWAAGKLTDRKRLSQARSEEGIILPLKSYDELEAEMKAWVAGEKDTHDRVVEEFKARLRVKHAAAQKEQERRRQQLNKAVEQESVKAVPLIGYTAAQVQQMLGGRYRPGVQQIIDEGPHERLRQKIESEVVSGDVQVRGDKIVAPSVALDDDNDTLSLQDRVARRRPSYGSRRES